MTTPLVLKAFSLIEKLNNISYSYIISWNPKERKLIANENSKLKLIPWYLANIVVIFLLHFCLPISLLAYHRSNASDRAMSNKEIFQLGALLMMSCHATATYGINLLIYLHADVFAPYFTSLLRFESMVRERYITSKDIKAASMRKELNPKQLATEGVDMAGLVMYFIIHTMTVVPAITPLSLVLEDVDPMGILIKWILIPDYDSLSWKLRLGLGIFRIAILTVAMLEISQTFRTMFNFGLAVIHIYNKSLETPRFQKWSGRETLLMYNQLRVIHAGMVELYTPLGAFFLGLNYFILTISTVLCLVSHRILPIQIYVGIPAATAMAYFLLFATLPYAIHCHEETQNLLLLWRKDIVTLNLSLSYWKRVIKTLKPIAYYCGNTGILTQSTKRNYMSAVIDGTVNVLLWRDVMN